MTEQQNDVHAVARATLREIDEAIEAGDFAPNPWERDFLNTIRSWISGWAHRPLSDKQEGVLDRIWKKAKGHE